MKEYIKWLKIWLWVFSVLLLLWTVTFFVIKARTVSDPDLWDNGSSLYTSVNETLTAAKRNALVKRTTGREDVNTWDNTSLFDMNCDRKFQAKWSDGNVWWLYPYSIYLWWQRIRTAASSAYWEIQYNAKWTVVENDSLTRTLLKLQKKCQ